MPTSARHSLKATWVDRLRSLMRRVRDRLAGSAKSGGLDDSALPSSFIAPHGPGGRHVRSLWHIPF
jgi:hypothetical protein